MPTPAISVRGLGKKYEIGTARAGVTLYETFSRALRLRHDGAAADPTQGPAQQFWALRDISFDIGAGEVVGLIGRNGAGKSTLLKILSRITAPTTGRAEVRGKLASLLEVGTGFHPELSGRENIFLNGAILGMTRDEVARKFDEIVAFAEVDRFIDTPVKRYSSGMYVRLAFAVAAHLEPDILVVDEVLAVGDADFQEKCTSQMRRIGRDGKTLLVVSHNMQLIRRLCPRAILLDKGGIVAMGAVDEVQSQYLSTAGASSEWRPSTEDRHPFQYDFVRIVPPEGCGADAIPADRPFDIEFCFRVESGITGRLALVVRNGHGIAVLTSSDTDAESFLNKRWKPGDYVERCNVPANLLAPGQYHLTISRPIPDGNAILDDVCTFTVDRHGSLAERDYREGVIAPLLSWTTRERT